MARITQNQKNLALAGARGFLRLERRGHDLADWLAFKLGTSRRIARELAEYAEAELRKSSEWTL